MRSLLEARLGFKDKPAKPNGTGDPGEALMAAHAAHKKGDHQTAKKHALNAANLLHQLTQVSAKGALPSTLPAAKSAIPESVMNKGMPTVTDSGY